MMSLKVEQTVLLEEGVLHINVLSPSEAMAQLAYTDHPKVRVSVFADREKMFLDTEGGIEFCRLFYADIDNSKEKQEVIPVFSCDYSACMVASSLGFSRIEVVLSHPLLEQGIMRPALLHAILEDTDADICAGGIFTEEEVDQLLLWGCSDVFQYQRERL
jgi:hypothetical protein